MNKFTELFLEMSCDPEHQDYRLMLYMAKILDLDVYVKDESGNVINHDGDMKLKNFYRVLNVLYMEVYDE